MNLWPYLSGKVEQSPRTEIFADSRPVGVLLKEIEGRKWKLFLESASSAGERAHFNDGMARLAVHWQGVPPSNYTGAIDFACHMGPQYPNASINPACNSSVPLPDEGLLYNLVSRLPRPPR